MASLPALGLVAVCAVVIAIFVPSEEACADSWALPSTTTTASPLGEYRFTVEPAPIDSRLGYFLDESSALDSGEAVERPAPIGLLERKNDDDKWVPVWAMPLVNTVAPVSVLVADDGEHVVTFDNWHSVGHGENVIVIYGSEGEIIRTMSLNEMIPQNYIDALPHSVSSLWWRGESQIEASRDELAIDVIVPGDQSDPDTIRFMISLRDGAVSKPDEAEWAAAQCAAQDRNEQLRKAEEERIAFFTNPLRAPAGCDISDWHAYVREAYYRLSPEGIDGSTATKILFPPTHERHRISVGWLVDAVAEEMDFPGNIAVASPCHDDALLPALEVAFADIPEGALTETTLYVSTSRENAAAIAQVITPSGATLVWLDPDQAIVQRPERIPGSPEKEAAEAERLERIFEEAGELLDEI